MYCINNLLTRVDYTVSYCHSMLKHMLKTKLRLKTSFRGLNTTTVTDLRHGQCVDAGNFILVLRKMWLNYHHNDHRTIHQYYKVNRLFTIKMAHRETMHIRTVKINSNGKKIPKHIHLSWSTDYWQAYRFEKRQLHILCTEWCCKKHCT